MNVLDIFHYDKGLEPEEEEIIRLAVHAVVKSIVCREKQPALRTLLVKRISEFANYQAVKFCTKLQGRAQLAIKSEKDMKLFQENFELWVEKVHSE